ncbi:MAG: hypothetical protein ABI082_00370, partial [Dokdonella sp.]
RAGQQGSPKAEKQCLRRLAHIFPEGVRPIVHHPTPPTRVRAQLSGVDIKQAILLFGLAHCQVTRIKACFIPIWQHALATERGFDK